MDHSLILCSTDNAYAKFSYPHLHGGRTDGSRERPYKALEPYTALVKTEFPVKTVEPKICS